MGKATRPVSINGIEFDALIDETRTLDSTVPEYSVESGFSVSDAIILNPEKLSMTLFVTNTPVTWHRQHGGNKGRVADVCKQLEELYYAGEPVTIITSDATYSSMAIESLTLEKKLDIRARYRFLLRKFVLLQRRPPRFQIVMVKVEKLLHPQGLRAHQMLVAQAARKVVLAQLLPTVAIRSQVFCMEQQALWA